MNIKEFKTNIINLINQSELPADIVELVLENILQQILLLNVTNKSQTNTADNKQETTENK